MNKVRNVLLATAFLTMAGIAGCKKVPDVIKETPAEKVDTTLTTAQRLDSAINFIETSGKNDKQKLEQMKKTIEDMQSLDTIANNNKAMIKIREKANK